LQSFCQGFPELDEVSLNPNLNPKTCQGFPELDEVSLNPNLNPKTCQGFPELDTEVADELIAEIGPGFRV
jgi:hypothetical protein